ncbi:Asp23/Gls24 family envelope stress response protein [Microbispora sp. H10836]|uniref:Asp23/Gls24 family envelope stress response protein n=1 Tax=Microbispora sp. H10836 TaxID=2729106 RepID=UPI001475E89C|nr:Asp23/Gls24 family envelope stress response protein [Microbispora sp. H10836]
MSEAAAAEERMEEQIDAYAEAGLGDPATEPEPLAVTPRPDAPTADVLKGRIKVADEVVEKVAALAALEIPGVADLGGDLERAFENVRDLIGVGAKRATQGVQAKIQDEQVSVDVTIVIVYGHVVMDVATEVKVNVARSVGRMLGMRVVEVNVTVDDVRLPGQGSPAEAAPAS